MSIDQTSESVAGKSIEIEWLRPEQLQTVYANNLIVQHTPSEFILSFFMVEPPLLTGTQEEKMRQLADIDAIPAYCVAKIVVAPDRLDVFVKALAENLQTYHDTVTRTANDE